MLCTFLLLISAVVIIFRTAVPFLTFFWKEQNLRVKYKAKTAMVTGGTSGIGLSIVRRLLNQGLRVVIVALDDEQAEQSLADLRAEYSREQVDFVAADFEQPESTTNVVNDIKAKKPNLLFCCAGFMSCVPITAQSYSEMVKPYLRCNVEAYPILISEFVKTLHTEHTNGAVVVLSSIVPLAPAPFCGIYNASKAFLTSYVQSIEVELFAKEPRIDFLVVQPGAVDTNFFKRSDDHFIRTERKGNKSGAMKGNFFFFRFLRAIGQKPDDVAGKIFKVLGRRLLFFGRITSIDSGILCVFLRVLNLIFDQHLPSVIGVSKSCFPFVVRDMENYLVENR